ncbi:MAG: response regulator transcription factor [Bacteroidales bacterium]|nr:response regulator transcription factor [Bacteroidales bacterium]
MKLLLVEDNQQLVEDIAGFLTEDGFVTESAGTLHDAEEKIALYQYDLVILDLGLPDGDGLDLIPAIQERYPETAILILTAKDGLDYKVKGLDWGADDYLTKPFHKAELNARVRSILRRRFAGGHNQVTFNELSIDLNAREVTVNNYLLKLTRKEYDLLLFFIYNKNRLLTKESIAEHLWGDHIDQADNFDFIYNHIKNLRRKISQAGGGDYIRSMYGMGYKFVTG